jgi:branched-chain amino acid transport system substrate-binding protein
VDLPSSDFSSAIARIVAMEQLPDAVFILLKGDAALAFAQQLLSAGIGPHKSTLIVLQHEGQDSTQFWEAVPNGVGTVIARIGPWPATVTDIGSRFADDYAQYSSTWPPASAFAAYDAVYVLHSAILAAQSLAGPDLVQALESTDLEVTGSLIRFPYNAGNPPGEAGAPAYNWHQHLSPQMLYLQYSVPEQPAQEVPVIWPAQYKTADLLTLR